MHSGYDDDPNPQCEGAPGAQFFREGGIKGFVVQREVPSMNTLVDAKPAVQIKDRKQIRKGDVKRKQKLKVG